MMLGKDMANIIMSEKSSTAPKLTEAPISSRSLTKSQFYFIFTKNLIENNSSGHQKFAHPDVFLYISHPEYIPQILMSYQSARLLSSKK